MSIPRFAIVHLFSTGACKSGQGLLHLGILPLEANARSQDWVINPQVRFGDGLYRRTQISNPNAGEAPVWEQLKQEVQGVLSTFDYLFFFGETHEASWLEQVVLQGQARPPQCADLALLTAFFCPDQTALDAQDLVETFQKGQPKQSGVKPLLRILTALQEQVLLILDRLAETTPLSFGAIPAGTALFHQLFEQVLALPGKFPIESWHVIHVALQHRATLKPADLFSSSPAPATPPMGPLLTQDLLGIFRSWLPAQPDSDAAKPRAQLSVPSDQIVAEALQSWCKEHGLDKREAQTEYAQFSNHALTQKGLFLAEAGTGTGKTIGYLIAAAEVIRANPGRKVVVATATKNLQDQVVRGEIPRLKFKGGLHEDLRAAVLKGKNNYLCLTAMLEQYDELVLRQQGNSRQGLGWLYLCLRLRYTNGEAEEIPANLRQRLPTLLDLLGEVNAQEMCVAPLCVDPTGCSYARQLEQAHAADIIVTNHHKLLQMPPKLEEKIQHCIIDEADQFPDNARNAKSLGFRSRVVWFRLIRPLLGSPSRKGYLTMLEERISQAADEPSAPRMGQEVLACYRLCEEIIQELKSISDAPVPEGEQRWQEPVRIWDGKAAKMVNFGEQILQALDRTRTLLQQLGGSLETIERLKDAPKDKLFARLASYRERATDLSMEIEGVCTDYPSREWVHVIEKGRSQWAVCRLPYSLKDTLDEFLQTYDSVLFTSATLYVGGTSDYFRYQVDWPEPLTKEFKRLSPFNYEVQAHAVMPLFLSAYQHAMTRPQKQEWLEDACKVMLSQIVALNGRTLVLFTSREELNQAHRWLEPHLQQYDIELLKQDGSSLWEIRRFRQEEHSVLLGLDRMWSGVDFPGSTLSQVIALRLPNPALGQPLVAHRREHEGAAFWSKYYHPTGRHKFRQGFGRLIRREKDRGVFVVLDSRIAMHPNMGHFEEEIPTYLHRLGDQRQLQDWTTNELLPKLELKTEWLRRNLNLQDLPRVSASAAG